MKIIDLHLSTRYFNKDHDNRLETWLAKFDLKKGDVLRYHEIDEKGRPTGRFYDRVVKDFHKIHKVTKYWSKKDLTKYGIYIFQLGKITKASR